ncbi:MAG TPA: glycosyl hydrolase family 18 protein [Bacillota bacterium]
MTGGTGTRYVRFGWVDSDDRASLDEALTGPARLTHAAPCWFAVDGDGRLGTRPRVAPAAHAGWVDSLRRSGVAVLPAVVNRDGDGSTVGDLVGRDEPRARAVKALERLCRDGGFDGITLAFRGAFPEARDAFSAFVEELAWTLHTAGARLALAVPPQVREPSAEAAPDPVADPEGWLAACAASFDYRALSVYADLFIIDTRDFPRRPAIERGDTGPVVRWAPGTVAPDGWLQTVLDHALLHVPARDLVLTLPLYGRAWAAGAGAVPGAAGSRAVPLRDVDGLLAAAAAVEDQPDRAGGGRVVRWSDASGRSWLLYADDPASLAAKAGLVARYDLGGAAFWRLGFGCPEAWAAVDRGLTALRRPV